MLPSAEFPPRRELTDLLRTHMRDAGFDWRVLEAPAQPYPWDRPPAFTHLTLAGAPLQPHVAIQLKVELDDVVDAYERFLGMYVFGTSGHRFNVVRYLGDSLGLSRYAGKQAFVPMRHGWSRYDLAANAAMVAALVVYNFEGEYEEGPDTFAVYTGAYQFGVRDGKILSNLRGRTVDRPVGKLRKGPGVLIDKCRGGARFSEEPSVYDSCRIWLDSNHSQIVETNGEEHFKALSVGIRVLWWRHGGRLPERLKDLLFKGSSDEFLEQACQEARGFATFERPLDSLLEIFVPQFLTRREFAGMFGLSVQPEELPPTTIMRWHAAIDELDPSL